MKLFGGLLNAICFQSFSTIHKQHLGLFSNFDHAKSGGKQGTLLTKVLMHLLCFKVIISRAFIPAVTMHVEPVCSEMCILQAEFFLIQIRPHLQHIPANFFGDIRVRFLCWECWDFLKTTRSFPKIPEEVRSLPKTSEVCRSLPKVSSLPVLFTSNYSFYTWFSFLTWV